MSASAAFAATDLKKVYGHFATGISIITGRQPDDGPFGLTVSSFQALSLDPPLVLYSVQKGAASLEFLSAKRTFGVSVLAHGQDWIARQFAERRPDRFANVDWTAGRHGSPLIDSAIAAFECELWGTYEGGDHVIVVGRVMDLAATAEGSPLVYFRGGFLPHGISASS